MDNASRPRRAIVFTLLAVHAGLLLAGSRQNFVTIDETGYVPAGLSHWQTGDFSWYRVNPPLPRMLATLPLLPARPNMPYDPKPETPGERREWTAGPAFAAANAERYFDLVCLARWAGVAWSLLGGWLVCRWSSELYGARAGYLSLALWCFGPNILAHAQLVTPDIPATVAGLAATYLFWHYLRRPSWTRAWFAGLLLGLAQLTKFTLLVLYGVWPVLAVLYAWRTETRGEPSPSRRVRLGQAALMVLLSVVVLNLGYGFTGTGQRLGDFAFVSRLFAGHSLEGTSNGAGNRLAEHWLGHLRVPLPTDYVLGIDAQRRDFESGWPCYLAGEWRAPGWWYFYLYALSVKVPLGTVVLVVGGLTVALLRAGTGAPWRDELTVWLPAASVLVLVSSQTGLQFLRYALPMAPFAFIGAGKTASCWRCGSGWVAAGVLGLLAWSVFSSLSVYPHSLAYFNEAAGGPSNGHAHLLDSNLDWGQDLLRLKEWSAKHPEAQPLHAACFTHIDPRLVGIAFRLPPIETPHQAAAEAPGPHLEPGYYVVSVNYVQGMPFPVPDGRGRFRRVSADVYGYFRRLRPCARVGHTLFIYHVRAEEAGRSCVTPRIDR